MSESNHINYSQLLQLLPDVNIVAFYRDFVGLGIGIKGAIMLSLAVHCQKMMGDPAGWWWKTKKEWMEETGMTREEIMTAQKRLVAKGYLEVVKRGVPARNFYRLRAERLIEDLSQLRVRSE